MCGIVGLYTKNDRLRPELGTLLSSMLIQMSDRGPDSAGVALYRKPAAEGNGKVTVQSPDLDEESMQSLQQSLDAVFGSVSLTRRANQVVIEVPGNAMEAAHMIEETHTDLRVTSSGQVIEIFKEKGLPKDVVNQYRLDGVDGTHALGHTRMATESAVTTEHSHPFSTGLDLCLVHNGSLSNHNHLRRMLMSEGIRFQTDNDSEVAAGYLTWRLSQGDDLEDALNAALRDLDGFYTFAIGTKDGFAVLRDPIACKPAVLAETDDWVAMASEYRAIAQLPGAENARIWEPEPATIYTWGG